MAVEVFSAFEDFATNFHPFYQAIEPVAQQAGDPQSEIHSAQTGQAAAAQVAGTARTERRAKQQQLHFENQLQKSGLFHQRRIKQQLRKVQIQRFSDQEHE